MDSYRNNVRQMIRKGDYGQAFRMIRKDLENRSRESSGPEKKAWSLYFACISLFGLGHIQQARKYYQQLLEVAGDSVSSRYIQAYLELQTHKPEEALVTLTSILELDPSDVRCDALIEQIKDHPDRLADHSRKRAGILDFFPGIAPERKRVPYDNDNDFESDDDPSGGYTDVKQAGRGRSGKGQIRNGEEDSEFLLGADRSALPPIGMRRELESGADSLNEAGGRRRRLIWMGLGILLLLTGLAAYFFGFRNAGLDLSQSDLPRPPGHSTVLPHEAGDFAHFYENKDQAVQEYEMARAAIEDGRVNQARKMLGRLERSNIDFVFKERARSLRQSIPLPAMNQFQDSITLAEIESDPFSYRDAVFLWDATVRRAEPTPTGMQLEVSLEDRSEGLRLQYSGTDASIRDGLKNLSAGDGITVFGRVLSSDDRGSNMTFQLLDFRPPRE